MGQLGGDGDQGDPYVHDQQDHVMRHRGQNQGYEERHVLEEPVVSVQARENASHPGHLSSAGVTGRQKATPCLGDRGETSETDERSAMGGIAAAGRFASA